MIATKSYMVAICSLGWWNLVSQNDFWISLSVFRYEVSKRWKFVFERDNVERMTLFRSYILSLWETRLYYPKLQIATLHDYIAILSFEFLVLQVIFTPSSLSSSDKSSLPVWDLIFDVIFLMSSWSSDLSRVSNSVACTLLTLLSPSTRTCGIWWRKRRITTKRWCGPERCSGKSSFSSSPNSIRLLTSLAKPKRRRPGIILPR